MQTIWYGSKFVMTMGCLNFQLEESFDGGTLPIEKAKVSRFKFERDKDMSFCGNTL